MFVTAVRSVRSRNRRGNILVLSAAFLVVVLGIAAFTVDLGFVELTKTQLQAAADASALAGAMELSATEDPAVVRTSARAAAVDVAARFENGDRSGVTLNPATDITFGKLNWNGQSGTYQIDWGDAQTPYNVIKVKANRGVVSNGGTTTDNQLPLFFAPVLGTTKTSVSAEAIATFQPRDIMVVLDFSSSMNDDSCLAAIPTLGRTYVENNLLAMWQQLGSPVYGNLTFTPKYATLRGVAASGSIPHIDVTYKRNKVDVVSTANITQVRLKFSNNATQTFTFSSGTSLTVQGTGGNAGRDIVSCWVRSGGNASMSSGNLGEFFDFTANNIKTALGLNGAYPYPGGNWADYISKVQASSGDIKDQGYRDMYGYLTWIEYLQKQQYTAAATPDLWKTSEQPVTALKDAVDVFIDYLQDVEAEDYMGLVAYSHPNSAGAILEHALSQNITQVSTTTRRRQAGHYGSGTGIGNGMQVAREELIQHARQRAARLMLVMTDGQANLPTNSTVARQKVLTEAGLARDNAIKIVTVSVGVEADTALMQQVADITSGVHFNVPGGQSVASVETQLRAVFQQIAASRPLKLIGGN